MKKYDKVRKTGLCSEEVALALGIIPLISLELVKEG